MSTIDEFFNENELIGYHNFRNDLLPTKSDCPLYVISRSNRKAKYPMTHGYAVNQLAKDVESIWNNGDCCPFRQKHIATLFEHEVWKPYLYHFIPTSKSN